MVERILLNLVVNARDAIADEGRITIATRNVSLHGHGARRLALPPGDYVELSVVDTGEGIDAAARSHLFEPFFTTKGRDAAGMGLPIVYAIATQAGGQVAVETEPGQGSRFAVVLPAARAIERRGKHETRRPAKQAATILFVEEDADVRAL